MAAPVAITTGRKVREETSGSISSSANITPPSGVLKVAAMPAPPPAATRVMVCQVGRRNTRPSVEPMPLPTWMIGPSRPTEAPQPIDSAEASDLMKITAMRTRPAL